MPRQIIEFTCSECSKIFDINLNTSLNGNYRIHCPNCDHVHYRVVEKGKITDARFPDRSENPLIEDIVPMKSCCRDNKKETKKDCYFGAKEVDYLHQLWTEKFSARSV
jgi:DNA-directed RNA polymerase subunit RPC12/RpoP